MLPVGDDPGADITSLVALARQAEEAGFDAVSLSDHVVMGPRVDRYPWGDFRYHPAAPWVEPLTALTAIAAVTTRLRLTTGILIAPLRPAALLAKWVASLDVLAGGRLELGVGTGWQEEEFAALGLDHAQRGQLLTDTMAACRELWTHLPATFSSPSVSFADVYCSPQPVRPGGPPILFSGTLTPRNRRRIVELGDGWIPIMGERRAGIADGVEVLGKAFEEAGRDPSTLRVRSTIRLARGRERTVKDGDGTFDLAATLEGSGFLVDIGVTDLAVPFSAFVTSEEETDRFFAAARAALARWRAGDRS